MTRNKKSDQTVDRIPATLKPLLKWGEASLAAAGIDSSHLDAKLLLLSVLSIDEVLIYSNPALEVSTEAVKAYQELISRRKSREPLAYIIGKKGFWKQTLSLNSKTLIPRPETEILVETVLSHISSTDLSKPLKLLDIGTGSGNIPISLALEVPSLNCLAIDISDYALEAARLNSEKFNLEERISFLKANLFELQFSDLDNGSLFDIIVSNPPYIRSAAIGALMPEVALFEPRLALDGGEDGLSCYSEIISNCQKLLAPGGIVVLEIDMGQATDIEALIKSADIFGELNIINDLAGIERVVVAKRLY